MATKNLLGDIARAAIAQAHLEERRTPAELAAQDMLAALKVGAAALREEIRLGGGCDHEVGICWCDVKRVADQMDDAIAKAEGKPHG